jgi:predicted dehydrogenase
MPMLRGEDTMQKPSIIVVGAGGRGQTYSDYVRRHPEEAEIVAVCEPREDYRRKMAEGFAIPGNMQFSSWEEIVDRPKLADIAMICTQDRMHREPAVALAHKGYHLLLEKPMATNEADCVAIRNAAKEAGVTLAVCHVLRYTMTNRTIKAMLDSGVIGRVHNIQLLEPVGYWHQAHSFVRGNWRNEGESSPMLLAKSCHDMDLLTYFMPGRCRKVSSFGSLSHFTRENQPTGAADRCTECPAEIESNCPYSAIKVYIRRSNGDYAAWPAGIISFEGTYESTMKAIEEGPYGRCVYACDNDVVDHQVVQLEFDDGAVASFTMSAFNPAQNGREIYIMGDRGCIQADDTGIFHTDFLTDERRKVDVDEFGGGHGGGDDGLMQSFLKAMREGDPSTITSGPDVSLRSHMIVFAAERSRKNGTIQTVE